ncbi:hypothetical protein TI39_contig532g00001 [Zymoseptoria brevis]|uniref:Uncharacterized protein n=1 Tax=Zymoseptoria brevis TaxID=1047168 RepID=A0A0F4GIB3_9PEZI|nr:hypothetical protein TI39_contig532g00001 [Zymoseptoria brevis]
MRIVFKDGTITKAQLPIAFLGVFSSKGVIHNHRMQIGRPAVTRKSGTENAWGYVCIAATYTLCSGDKLRELFRSYRKEDYFGYNKQRVYNYCRSGRTDGQSFRKNGANGAKAGQPAAAMFTIDEDEGIEVDWEIVQWPTIVDQDRVTPKLLDHITADIDDYELQVPEVVREAIRAY